MSDERPEDAALAELLSIASEHPHLGDLARPLADRVRDELFTLRRDLRIERERRTLGGTPPVPAQDWGNLARTPPPATASDPDAPALHRRTRDEDLPTIPLPEGELTQPIAICLQCSDHVVIASHLVSVDGGPLRIALEETSADALQRHLPHCPARAEAP